MANQDNYQQDYIPLSQQEEAPLRRRPRQRRTLQAADEVTIYAEEAAASQTKTKTQTNAQETAQKPRRPQAQRRDVQRTQRQAPGTPRANAGAKNPRKPGAGKKSPKKGGFGIGQVQLVLLALIVLVAVIAVVRLKLWNRGSKIVLDPETSARFDVEVNDSIVYLPDSKLEGHPDDGQTTILCLGGDPFAADRSGTGLAGQIAELGEATVYNAAFPHSRATCRNWPYSTDTIEDMDDIFNFFYVSYAIATGDFSVLETVAGLHTDDSRYAESIEVLKTIDMNTVDIIAVMYDGIDYEQGAPVYNQGNEEDLASYVGSLLCGFDQLQQAYPFIRIVFLSPTYMLLEDEQGELNDGRVHDIGNGTLVQYWQFAFDACGKRSVSFLDNYYGSVNDVNYEDYLDKGRTLNQEGFRKIADHFVYKVVQGNYTEYDALSLMVAK